MSATSDAVIEQFVAALGRVLGARGAATEVRCARGWCYVTDGSGKGPIIYRRAQIEAATRNLNAAADSLIVPLVGNPLLDIYRTNLAHSAWHRLTSWRTLPPEAERWCFECYRAGNQPAAPAPPPDAPPFVDMHGYDDEHRVDMRSVYAYAIPDDDAIAAIRRHSPGGIVEIGAGTGYWAALLARDQPEGYVAAYDLNPPGANDNWCSPSPPFHRIEFGGPEVAGRHPDRTLLLCWPPYAAPMAALAVRAYHGAGGQTVAYIGEGRSGCTADEDFFRICGGETWCERHEYRDESEECTCIAEGEVLFTARETVAIPQWSGLHDSLTIYTRA